MVNKSPNATMTNSGSDADRRRHQRVPLPLSARFLAESGEERAALVVNISATGALLRTKQPPEFGEAVVLYIDNLGRFPGRVIRKGARSFAVSYERKRDKSAKTADDLTELINTGKRRSDRRAAPRIRSDAPAQVFFDDGRVEDCAILDISLTGASLQITPRPTLGTNLILGRMKAKVVRRHEKGVGVIFTGTAKKMEDVLAETSPPREPLPDDIGIKPAATFGKKTDQEY